MRTFKYSFIGRERGAIGCTYPIKGNFESASLKLAEFTLRNEYEIFHSFMLVEVK